MFCDDFYNLFTLFSTSREKCEDLVKGLRLVCLVGRQGQMGSTYINFQGWDDLMLYLVKEGMIIHATCLVPIKIGIRH